MVANGCGPLAAALVLGVLALEARGLIRPFALPTLLGNASYSIYLWHTFAISVVAKVGERLHVAPGLTLKSGDQSEEQFARVAGANLLRRPVGAEAVAEGVVYLLGARSVTGQTLYVDSGQRFVRRDGDVMFDGEPRRG